MEENGGKLMANEEDKHDTTFGCESNTELNGDASYRRAPMISAPRTVLKRRIGGALVPIPREQ